VPPDTSKPVRLTMLWPLADRPRLAAGAPGGTTPVRLIDDDLATSLAAGGRLDILLSAVDFATSPPVDPGGEVRNAMCLAVDPDLLVTVNAMAGGYVVNDAPDAGPGTPTHPGAGQDAAIGWLNRLKALGQRLCVTPTTYSQADLDALQRVGDPGLNTVATKGAADIVDQILGVSSIRGATLVGDGPLTGPAVELLSAQGPRSRSPARISRRTTPRPASRRPQTSDRCGTRLTWSPRRSTKRRCRAGRRRHRTSVAVVPGSVAGHPGQTRFGGRPPPGCAGVVAVARPAPRHRATHPDP
jgi:hypothetical protein